MDTRLTEASTEKICELLLENGFDNSVSSVFRDNKVDGAVFVDLDKDDMKELGISALGDRKKLQQLIYKLKRSEGGADCSLAGSTPSRLVSLCPVVDVPSPGPSSSDSCVFQGQNNSPCSEEIDSGMEQLETSLQSRTHVLCLAINIANARE